MRSRLELPVTFEIWRTWAEHYGCPPEQFDEATGWLEWKGYATSWSQEIADGPYGRRPLQIYRTTTDGADWYEKCTGKDAKTAAV